MHWFSCYFVASVVRMARSDEWYALHYTGWVSFAALHRNGSPEWGGAPLMSGNAAPQDSRTILLGHFSLPLFLFSREEGEEGEAPRWRYDLQGGCGDSGCPTFT